VTQKRKNRQKPNLASGQSNWTGQQAASPAHMDGSMLLARWRQCAPHHAFLGHPSPNSKRHLDRFSRFCGARYCERQTDWPTDHATRSV